MALVPDIAGAPAPARPVARDTMVPGRDRC